MLHYCKKCGRLVIIGNDDKTCDCCRSVVYPVPDEYLIGETKCIMKRELKQQFIDEYIKTSPEFDQYLFDHRDGILAEQTAKYEAAMARGRAIMEEKNRVPKCISCGSTNVSKIGAVSRGISAHLFGIASSKVGKTYKCNHCGTMW